MYEARLASFRLQKLMKEAGNKRIFLKLITEWRTSVTKFFYVEVLSWHIYKTLSEMLEGRCNLFMTDAKDHYVSVLPEASCDRTVSQVCITMLHP